MEKEAETASSRQAGVKPLAPKKSQQSCCRRDCEVAERRAAVRAGRGRRMLLAGPGTELKGKLTEKMRYRPTAMIRPLMPAGASSLERLPSLMEGGLSDYELLRSEPTEQQLDEYSGAVRKTAKVFSSMQVKAGTVAERDKYVVWVDAWCKLNGFGSYIVLDDEVRSVRARLRAMRAQSVTSQSVERVGADAVLMSCCLPLCVCVCVCRTEGAG